MLQKTPNRKSAHRAHQGRRTPSSPPSPPANGQARRVREEVPSEALLDERLKSVAKESFGLMGED
jgi:hypothetical protein